MSPNTENMSMAKVQIGPPLEKGQHDAREYLYFTLPNQLRVVVISDPATDKAAAAMDVHVGHMHDPDDLPGLAHFLEHMLFLGTEKYPNENDFSQFLAHHGGSSNATTGLEHTNYYFDVQHAWLEPALDRWSQFFVCPLFNEDAQEREVQAVSSEHEKNLNNDYWRISQLDKSTASPAHPYSKFGTGTLETLITGPKARGIDVRAELLRFHGQWYSANIMALAVLGRESCEVLKDLVISKFSGVENKNVAVTEWSDTPYEPQQLKQLLAISPVKEYRTLEFNFLLCDTAPYYCEKPVHYLSHLVGHEGEGSLLSLLKANGWVTGLSAGGGTKAKGFGTFRVSMNLTEMGLGHIFDIGKTLFQYIRLLRDHGIQEWIYEECKELNAMLFEFKDNERPASYVSSVASCMQLFPAEYTLSGGYLFRRFDPALIGSILAMLTPDRLRMGLVSKSLEYELTETETWYQTRYARAVLDNAMLEEWASAELHPSLALPGPNEFIATDFEVRAADPADEHVGPAVIVDTPHVRCWHKLDDKFKLPKAIVHMEITSPSAYATPRACVLTRLFTELFKESLAEYSYIAEVAGLSYSLDNSVYGLVLTLMGYSHKLPVLLRRIVDKMVAFTVDDDKFPHIHDLTKRAFANFDAEQPYQHCIYYTHFLCTEKLWTHHDKLAVMDDITADDVRAFVPMLLSRLHIEALVHGNLSRDEASLLMAHLAPLTCGPPLRPAERVRHRHCLYNTGTTYVYEMKESVHRDNAVEVYLGTGMDDPRGNPLVELFNQVIFESFFNVLRTQEQLGYIVHAGLRRQHGANGMRFVIQSDRSPDYLDGRIDAFLLTVEDTIANMPDEAFVKHVGTLVAKKLEADKGLHYLLRSGQSPFMCSHGDRSVYLTAWCQQTLAELSSRFWNEILEKQYHFGRAAEEAGILRTISKGELLAFYREKLKPGSEGRCKISVRALGEPKGAGTQAASGVRVYRAADEAGRLIVIDNAHLFKQTLGMHALPTGRLYINVARL